MKNEIAKEYLVYAKKQFSTKKKKFGNLGVDLINYIKEKKERNSLL